jgi:hypothetical protein
MNLMLTLERITMCEHNKKNTGKSYCAYCRVNELTTDIERLLDYLNNIMDRFVINDVSKAEYEIAVGAMKALQGEE